MRVFITGIRGFIPSHLANYLSGKGNFVYGIDNNLHPSANPLAKNVQCYYGDVRYSEDIEQYVRKADVVYHLAAQINVDKSIAFPQETIDINLSGTLNVLNACRRYHKKMVFASTSEIYGGHDSIIKEGDPTYAQSPYAVAKLAADKLCGNFHELYELPVWRVRCFNTFGPYQSDDQYGAVIPIFAKRVMNNKAPMIFGDGNQKRDYMYIDDAVRAYEFVPRVKELEGEPVNVGSGRSVSINYIAKLITKYWDSDLEPVHVAARAGEVCKLQANIDLIKKHGFKPKVKFEDGLKRYLDWLP